MQDLECCKQEPPELTSIISQVFFGFQELLNFLLSACSHTCWAVLGYVGELKCSKMLCYEKELSNSNPSLGIWVLK